MTGQSQIQRRLSAPASIVRVRQLTAENPDMIRTELADLLCDEFNFVDRRFRRQRGGCLKALRVLEGRGLCVLPAPQTMPGPSRPRRLESDVPLVGRQLRYLLGSEHGCLGGMGFASAALHLNARDRWIGWDLESRRTHLDRAGVWRGAAG